MTVAEEGQVTRAAARLHLSQPALSNQLSRLEESVGIRLLDRHARGVSLTPAGVAFLAKARATLIAAEETEAVLGRWLREETGLCIGFLSFLQGVARPLLRRYMEAHPDVDVQVRHLTVAERLVKLKRGEIDVEVLLPPPRDPDLAVATILRAPRHVLLAESHPLAAHRTLEFEQIANETFPGRHPSVSEEWAEEAWLSNFRGSHPPVTAETPVTADELWTLIYAGKAIAVLPDFMVPPTAGNGVRAIPLIDVEPVEVGIARRNDDARLMVNSLFDVAGKAEGDPRPNRDRDAPREP